MQCTKYCISDIYQFICNLIYNTFLFVWPKCSACIHILFLQNSNKQDGCFFGCVLLLVCISILSYSKSMMSAMKTMMAVVLDATPSMDSSVSADGVSKLNLGISIINYHIMQRQMASKTVEFSVSSFGNGATNNYCNSNDGSCPNVETVCPMGRPSVEDLKRIDAITVGGDDAGESDIADAIHVAFDSLQRVNAGKKYNRIMLIITDGEFYTHDTSRLEAIFREMKDSEMSCYVALLGKKDPSLLSHTVSENSKMLSAMASVTGGAFAILDSVSDSFYFFSGRPGMTSRPMNYKIPFYISPSVKVRCQYWGKVSKTSLPSLKKQSQSYDPDQPDSGVVKRTTSYVNPDDPDQEIPFDEKIKGYRYGSQFVPVTGADEAALKLSSEPLIRLLGFYPQSKLQRYHFMDSTLVLQGDSSSPAATRAIAALSLALTQNKSVALVRFVKRADSDPWLAALIPFPSDGMIGSLIIQRLPCAEDIRDFPFPSLYDKRFGSPNTTTQMAAVSAFVDQITVIPDDIAVFNPAFSSLIGKFLEHIMGDRKAASLQAVIVNPLEGSSEILSRGDSALKRIISEFPLEFVDKKKKKRKIYWSDYEVAATSEDIKIQSISVTVS